MALTEQFGRQCHVSIGEQVGAGAPLRLVKQVDGYRDDRPQRSGLRIAFRVNRKLDSVADEATISIYNLSRESRAALAQRSIFIAPGENLRYVQLSAGYDGNVGAIFNGAIVKVTNVKRPPDWVTTIEASAAVALTLGNNLDKSWGSAAGVPIILILNQMFQASGMPLPTISPQAAALLSTTMVNTQVASGPAYESIRGILSGLGLTFNLDTSGTYIVKPGEPTDLVPLPVNEFSGLMGAPQVGDLGVDFRTLLDPRISPGKLLLLSSVTLEASIPGLSGLVTAWDLEVVGDTHTYDWYCDVHSLYYPLLVKAPRPVSQPPAILPLGAST